MAKQNVALPSVTSILAQLRYDRASGDFFWRHNYGKARIGALAGSIDTHGYRVIRIDRRNYKAHRLVWLIERGEPVPDQLDHRNCVRTDNRVENLRPATDSQQQWNKSRHRNNKSGFKGVHLDYRGKWVAMICHHYHVRYIGTFATAEDAHAAYCAEAKRLKGEFAQPG